MTPTTGASAAIAGMSVTDVDGTLLEAASREKVGVPGCRLGRHAPIDTATLRRDDTGATPQRDTKNIRASPWGCAGR